MNHYRISPLSLRGVKTYPLASRLSKVKLTDFAQAYRPSSGMGGFLASLPKILAGNNLRAVGEAILAARRGHKPIVWGLGGHVTKCGLNPVLLDLMRRGFISCFVMNGAAMIHDFEVAWLGQTSEDVEATLEGGRFGMADETSRFLNVALTEGELEGLGAGEAVGRSLVLAERPTSRRRPRFPQYSLLAAAYKQRIPVTVHLAVGTDIITNHPSVDAAALGSASHRDFLLLAGLVSKMANGGVYLNIGSAVILPEVFLKCVSLARNLGHRLDRIVTANFDFIQHYRPTQNVVIRPPGRTGRGYALTGHHELMIPLLAAALIEADRKKGRRKR